jgi:hypothetical protein
MSLETGWLRVQIHNLSQKVWKRFNDLEARVKKLEEIHVGLGQQDRCATCDKCHAEMEERDDGDWVRYEDAQTAIDEATHARSCSNCASNCAVSYHDCDHKDDMRCWVPIR